MAIPETDLYQVGKRKSFINQLAVLSILLAFILVVLLPFSGAVYWNQSETIGTYLRQHHYEIQGDIEPLPALIIFGWRGIIVAGIGVTMVPILFGMFMYYRKHEGEVGTLIILLVCEILAAVSSLALKEVLLDIVNQPFPQMRA